MELKQIASFAVDHTKLVEGMYTSRVDGDVTTYDIRMVKPNCGTYLPYPAIHSFEHLFATYVRSSVPSSAISEQNVCRQECGVMRGSFSSWNSFIWRQ